MISKQYASFLPTFAAANRCRLRILTGLPKLGRVLQATISPFRDDMYEHLTARRIRDAKPVVQVAA